MRDCQAEALYYPKQALPLEDINSVLCLAPHPDDEVLGCGGLLSRLAQLKCRIQVLIFSCGESATGPVLPELAVARKEESRRAARVLGLNEPRFLDWPDRGMRYGEPLIAEIQAALAHFQPQYLLLPSLSEPHPDHQVIALAGIAAAQRSPFPGTLLFYEVGAPLHPNVAFDMAGVAALKWQAVGEFVSQLAIQPYEEHARAMASVRAFGVGEGCTAAEAFFRVEAVTLRSQGAAAALPFWPMVRAQQQLANTPQQLPLVSILVRSIDRPQLTDAVAAVAAQTYPHIELVVVNASGRLHSPVQYPAGRLTLQLVNPGSKGEEAVSNHFLTAASHFEPCDRARAANLALRAAQGDLALFLDDDDVIDAGHIERLVGALASYSPAVAAYTGVRVEGADGSIQRIYDLPWSRQRLWGINFLPIHAVLFRLDRVRDAALSFDESLPVLEDWDFWRKLSVLGEFAHCPGVSAVYRQGNGHSGIGDPLHPNHWQHWHRTLLERDQQMRSGTEIAETLAWHAVELDRLQSRFEQLQGELEVKASTLAANREALASQAQQLALETQALEQAIADLELARLANHSMEARYQYSAREHAQAREQYDVNYAMLEAEMQLMQRSRSWRITRPLRIVTQWLQAMRS